jgi:RNA polymerase sigma factor (sigma-70 family)
MPYKSASEIELIAACQNNESAAQEELFKRYYNTVFKICTRYARNSEQAKDFLQDSFIKTFKNISSFTFSGSFEGWIKKLTVNTCLDALRKEKTSSFQKQSIDNLTDNEHLSTIQNHNFDENVNINDQQSVFSAIQNLTPAYRATLNLFVFENLTHKEISDKLGISVGSSKSNLAKARIKLQELLKNKLINGAA